MLNEQVMGLLQNNAGNPAIVKRIAEENQLSQTEIAQALKIPEEAAARYMPSAAANAMPVGAANAASQALLGGDNVERVGDTYAGRVAGGGGISGPITLSNAGSTAGAPAAGSAGAPAGGTAIGQPGGGMASGQALRPGAIGGDLANPIYPGDPGSERFNTPISPGIPSAPMEQRQILGGKPGMRQEVAPAPMEKPPASMTKPAKLPADMKPQGMMDMRGQMRRPNTTALPGDEEFQRAFDRIRGARA